MKKKIPISVRALTRKQQPQHPHQHKVQQENRPCMMNEAKSFQEMYRYVLKNKNNSKLVFDSKKTTPSNSRIHHVPATSYSNHSDNHVDNHHIDDDTNSRDSMLQQLRQNISSVQFMNSMNTNNLSQNYPTCSNRTFQTKQSKLQVKEYTDYDKVITKLNHNKHSHIRENECFLNESQVQYIMKELNYHISSSTQPYYHDLLQHLQVTTYGGVPSQNLKLLLQIVDGTYFGTIPNTSKNILSHFPNSIVNKNLKISISQNDALSLHQYYQPLRKSKGKQEDKKDQDHKKTTIQQIFRKVQELRKENEVVENDLDTKLNKQLQMHKVKQNSKIASMNIIQQEMKPILSVDVNLGEGVIEKIIVYEGETSKQVSQRLMHKFTLNEQTRIKFQKMLENHLSKLLWKIDEVNQELISQRQ